ncbi:hypothetical protein [Picosynechococcus sp. NKBG042902]|uniref:hypothetical protein n=1 Tax=Picosynechococcus sp. NKBG042902 TaxID=490193 RepID=UPI0004AA94AD|nr:hypothetical protein [Picosynechococcus sp. NKBG042902]
MITVKVVSKSTGKDLKGKRVRLGFDGNWLPGNLSADEYTDSNGEAHFDYDSAKGCIYVNGSTKYRGRLEGRIVVYI